MERPLEAHPYTVERSTEHLLASSGIETPERSLRKVNERGRMTLDDMPWLLSE